MIRAAAFCPHPPLLVPEVAQGAAAELDELRAACRTAIRRVVRPGSSVVVLGAGPRWRRHGTGSRGSLAGFGVDREVALGSDEPGAVELPLSLTIGAWLLREAVGTHRETTGWSVGPDEADETFQVVPADGDADGIADGNQVLLVMGDGSARRSTTAPGYLDERAAGFDAAVVDALGSGDGRRLRLDRPELAAELLVAGARAWDAAAHVLEEASPFDAEVLYDDAPYGVGYFVAAWVGR